MAAGADRCRAIKKIGETKKMEAVRTDITLKWIALFVTCAGAYMDLKHQKIPNKLTMPSILLGVLLNNL